MPRLMVWKPLGLLILALVAMACAGEPITLRLSVEPAEVELTRGESVDVTATLVRNGVPETLQNAVWEVGLAQIAGVASGPNGTATITGVANGATQVSVKAFGLTARVQVTVVSPAFADLMVDPPAVNLPAGLETQLSATARLADGASQPVNNLVTWTSSEPGVATVDEDGKVIALDQGTTIVTATLDELTAFATVTVTAARLTEITVAPATPQIPVGVTQQMTATGTYTDGATRDITFQVQWTSSQPGVATITPGGVVTGGEEGQTTIRAQMSTVSGSTTLTVVPPELTAITVTPASPSVPAGRPLQFTATGTYSDGSTASVSAMATWSSTNQAVATVAAGGLASTLATGTTSIRATVGGVSGMTTLTVTPPVLESIAVTPQVATMVPRGRTQQFTATGTYSDGSTMNLTSSVTWGSTMAAVATISNTAPTRGLATAVDFGVTTISATSGQLSGIATMSVGAPALDLLRVEPTDISLPMGASQQMRAMGTFSDGSTVDLAATAMWSSSMPARASVNATGRVTAIAQGATTITVQHGALMANTTVTVTPAALASIALTPINPSVTAGGSQQFTATGTYSNGSTANLTTMVMWSSSAPAVATVSNAAGSQGLATTLAGGTTTITATSGAISGSTTLTSQAVTVSAFVPADGTAAVRPTAPVSFVFSQAMDPASLFGQTLTGACAGNLQLSGDNFASCVAFTATAPTMSAGNTVATLQPLEPLVPLRSYRLRATGTVRSAANVPMGDAQVQAVPFAIATDGDCAAALVISQVFGGGGNAGAPVLHDFIELHNPGPVAVSLTGLSLQYAAAGADVWLAQALPAVDVPAGGYFLVRQAAGAGAQPALANPDFTPMTPFMMGAVDGKVALVRGTTPLAGQCPLGATLDLVGYGAATCFEGAAAVPALTSTTAALRDAGGCTDRNQPTDFVVGAPTPKNGMTPAEVCVCYVNETDLQAEVDYCNLQFPTVVNETAPHLVDAVYARVYEAGLTEAAGAAPVVRVSIGFGPADSDPTTWPWAPATFNVSVGNDDEYQAPLTFAAPGNYDFTSRATRDGTNWTLCDIDGAGSNPFLRFDQFQTGSANIAAP